MDYLRRIFSLSIPDQVRTPFNVIVDNPDLLLEQNLRTKTKIGYANINCATADLEKDQLKFCTLHRGVPPNICVRCNAQNVGALASINREVDESAAEFVLFWDDYVIPSERFFHLTMTPSCR
jgi:hypothetical protein